MPHASILIAPNRSLKGRRVGCIRWYARVLGTAATVLLGMSVTPAWALYDPAPDASLAAVQGEWKGSLTYRDYSEPDRMVTLPTRVFVALASPQGLVLHYVFDDGPAKTVYSYERMRFDVAAKRVTWTTGTSKPRASTDRIVSDTSVSGVRTLVFEHRQAKGVDRFTLSLGARELNLGKDEIDRKGATTFRDKYVFTRP